MRLPSNILQTFFPSILWKSNSPYLYLTFDDGPSPVTPLILETLARYNISATFFLTGSKVQQYPHFVRELFARGHSIGNHGYTHTVLVCKKESFIRKELLRTNDSLAAITGTEIRLFRPPYGYFDPKLLRITKQLQLKTVLWSFDVRDFSQTQGTLTKIKLNKLQKGDIILCHDNEQTAPIVVSLIERIAEYCFEHNFTFSTVIA